MNLGIEIRADEISNNNNACHELHCKLNRHVQARKNTLFRYENLKIFDSVANKVQNKEFLQLKVEFNLFIRSNKLKSLEDFIKIPEKNFLM